MRLWTCRSIAAATALAAGATGAQGADGADGDPAAVCDNKPVYMVVYGVTHDRRRMQAYGRAIAQSGLYVELRGYYTTGFKPLAVFEGSVADDFSMVAVRFPCLAHARAFWYSKTYQEDSVPMREGAGDYTVIVMPAAELPPYMAGRVGPADYVETFGPEPAAGIAQVAKVPEFAEAPNE